MKSLEKIKATERTISHIFEEIADVELFNQEKVLAAFRENKVSDSDFNPTTGYGYDDYGRDKLESVYASVFKAEDALVRPQISSGTHAITTALFGVLRPGDQLLYITGKPYDTLESVIQSEEKDIGSLADFGIDYQSIPLKDNTIDMDSVRKKMSRNTKVVAIQRSKGYDNRPSISMKEMKEVISKVREINRNVIIFVDNCYGEFVEKAEPIEIGADLIAGSLIKNPGGGIARTGGYVAGTKELVEKAANRLTAPGIGKEIGASLGMLQEMFQGLFLAPHIVSEALRGAIFTSKYLSDHGYQTEPHFQEKRTDLIQSVIFRTADEMIAFCQSIQEQSPINAHVTPYPAPMPGYNDQVIMAAGTFMQGASLELTADGPIRPPYTAYVQGGLTYAHVKLAVVRACDKLNIR
ncbi:aminotransferase class I/II-fold pyridoxal phosphate-dependent enzyme [Gracilibacillus xinjiangensis]|uniref:Aminotransferase class I/II-fold pyridoxal phosphate-dependent enzyme n=1 Tax=Gracilibacillus xinjiangensis TaxID=1193282 RepID=A0ABV8X2H6_9BACI